MTRPQGPEGGRLEPVDATFLVVDIRGWSDIVHALGPDPMNAARLVDAFWTRSEARVREQYGEVYSWQGDALLVAYRGRRRRRMERALRTAEAIHAVARTELEARCWELLRLADAEAQCAGNGRTVSRALHFAVSSAITDGKAIAVSRRDADRRCDELTGDCVNLAFSLVKHVPPNHVGITADVHAELAGLPGSRFGAFTWTPGSRVPLAGAQRLVHTGTPAVVPPAADTADGASVPSTAA